MIKGMKLGLENMKNALKALGDDFTRKLSQIRFVHVAGTNGKGSTCNMLHKLLTDHTGSKTGLFTSPHLERFNERIKINNNEISNSEIEEIKTVISDKCSQIPMTFFEEATLTAFIHFVNNNCEFAVLETGLGGRLDSTNIIHPEISIITGIDFDHMQYLGNTLRKIAYEKAGIIKEGSTLIISKIKQNNYIKEIATKRKVKKIYEIGGNIKLTINDDKTFNINIEGLAELAKLRKTLNGDHQYYNTSVAITALLALGINTDTENINKSLSELDFKGRLEKTEINNKTLFLDVSHNLSGIEQTLRFIEQEYPGQKLLTVCSFMKDKEYGKMLTLLSEASEKVFAVPSKVEGREIHKNDYLNLKIANMHVCDSFEDAMSQLLKYNGIGLLTGSIFNYKKLKDIIGNYIK